jgi:DNA-binding transcriptional LysR family regulator
MLDPRRLLTFREVARQQSFSRAALALALTQPAVSQQIRALELQLGERLIERGGGKFALTAAGELLLKHAEALHERLQLAETQLGEAAAESRRELRLGAFPSALATVVPDAITQLRVETELEVSALQGSTEDLVAAVRDGRVHVALCFQDAGRPRREHHGTLRTDVLDEPMLATLAPDHRLASRKRIRLAELAPDPWLAATRDGLIVNACRAAGFEPRLAYLSDNPPAINRFVTAGLAVTLTSRLLAPWFRDVTIVALSGEPVQRTIYAVTPPGRVHPLAAAFVDAVRARGEALAAEILRPRSRPVVM